MKTDRWFSGPGLRIFFALAMIPAFSAAVRAGTPLSVPPTFYSFRHEMPATIRADHPAILPVAAAIRAVTFDPLQQLVMVNDVTHLLVDYDDDARVYGVPEHYATLDGMLAKRRQEGWLYLRDDCDGRAVFAAHLLASLGIPWRLEASYWKRHAWVVASVGGSDYDLLDFHPDEAVEGRLAYRLVGHWFARAPRQPPWFDWHRRWAEATGRNLLVGLRLGLLALDSAPGHLHERHATDWTRESPEGSNSPLDDRMLMAACAGFPYGDALRVDGLASATTDHPPEETSLASSPGVLAGNSQPAGTTAPPSHDGAHAP